MFGSGDGGAVWCMRCDKREERLVFRVNGNLPYPLSAVASHGVEINVSVWCMM
jgi:hypothetical protein